MTTAEVSNSRGPANLIRSALPRDEAAAVSSLARAFWSDPFLLYFYPDEAVRERKIRRFFRLLWRASLPLGKAEVAGGCSAVALWHPPGKWRIPRSTIARSLPAILQAYGTATARVFRCLSTMEDHHPRQPHWYLATIGTDPEMKGRGLAGKLLRSRLERCDAQGEAAYLEAATEALVPFYEGFGFRPLGEVKIQGGPLFHPMWRDPPKRGTAEFIVWPAPDLP